MMECGLWRAISRHLAVNRHNSINRYAAYTLCHLDTPVSALPLAARATPAPDESVAPDASGLAPTGRGDF